MKTFLLVIFFIPLYLIASFEPRIITPAPVLGYKEVTFYDKFQKANRELLIWYPVHPITPGTISENPWDVFQVAINAVPFITQKKIPVVVISHGYTGNPHQLSWLIKELVNQGYLVLGMQHRDLIDGKAHANHWQRAQDVRLMIDQLSANQMANFADLNKIAIAGYSLGGTTAIWIAGGRSTKLNTFIPGPEYASGDDFTRAEEALPTLNKEMMARDWRDSRVKAAFALAPAWAWLFDEQNLRKVKIPTYLIASASDEVLVSKNNAGFFGRMIPQAKYQEIPGKGGHYIFISAIENSQRKAADPKGELNFLFEDDASIDRGWIQSQVANEGVRFFNSVFKN
jgi:predicted dienelactone hydrolase